MVGARLGSPLSGLVPAERVRMVYVEAGLDRLSPAMAYYVRRAAKVLHRLLLRMRAEPIFHVLPVGGVGPAVPVSAEEYVAALGSR